MTNHGQATSASALLLLGPIDAALAHARTNRISDEGAHEARKALKEARAALRLLRPALGDAVYRRENATLRDASRAISKLRDAKVQMDAFAAIRERYARRWRASDLAPLEQRMRAELDRVRRDVRKPAGDLRQAAKTLQASRRRLVRLPERTVSGDEIDAGLARIYRQARKEFDRARKSRTADVLHEWRKKTKYLSNAIRLTGDGARARRSSLAKRAERLADWLGEEHDLAVLAATAMRIGPAVGEPAAARLQRLIERRRCKLQEKSLRLGAGLYDKKPSQAIGR